MASPDEVKKLAALARIAVPDAALEKFAKEFDAILAYVGQLESLTVSSTKERIPKLRNVMRTDGTPHDSGIFTERIASQFKERDGDYLKVKKIISHD